jgi:hypothetical protein
VTTKRIGVVAGDAHGRPRLLGALERAFPVRFEPRAAGELAGLDALIAFGAEEPARQAAAAELPALALLAPEQDAAGAAGLVSLADVGLLDRRLRGRALRDDRIGALPALARVERAEVLATHGGEPVWTRAGLLDVAAAAPLELGPREALRARLAGGRCLGLLPLVHLLRAVTADVGWQPPPARAALLLDDPNLHWPSYGFVDLAGLAAHARAHGYHLALAMIPLDARFAHRSAVRVLRENPQALSLLVHGNDHTAGELGRPANDRDAITVAAHALRRIAAFERRSGLEVDRVMAPPHESCSHATVRGLLACGFEAISMTRPHPWLCGPGSSWLASPPGEGSMAGWRPAGVAAGGLPVVLRSPLTGRDSTELVLRAFLDQPLVLYGHHGDLEPGLSVLEEAVAEANAVAAPRWCSLAEIARSGFHTRREGALLRVQLLARRALVEVPAGIEQVAVELVPEHGRREEETLVAGAAQRPLDEPFPAQGGEALELGLERRQAVDPHSLRDPGVRPLALARRVAGEGRDRTLPLLGRGRRAVARGAR